MRTENVKLLGILFSLAAVSLLTGCPAQSDTCTASTVSIVSPGAIVIDGKFEDWKGITPLLQRPTGAASPARGWLTSFSTASDRSKLYLRIDAVLGQLDGGSQNVPSFRIAARTNGRRRGDLWLTTPVNCGGSGQSCCSNVNGSGSYCNSGFYCENSVCKSCGSSCSSNQGSSNCQMRWDEEGSQQESCDVRWAYEPNGRLLYVEASFSSASFGNLLSLYPTISQQCSSDNCSPTVLDEIGCAWANWQPGSGSGDGARDGGSCAVSCGGACCASGQVCTSNGKCCTPSCGTLACGPDPSCGVENACGTCTPPATCQSGGYCQEVGTSWGWSYIDVQWRGELTGLWGSSAQDIWAVGRSGSGAGVFHSTDTGGTWTKISTQSMGTAGQSMGDLYGVWGVGSRDVWVVGFGGVLRFDGSAWAREVQREQVFYSVWAAAENDVWAIGDSGLVWHRVGADWIDVSNPLNIFDDLRSVWGTSAGVWGIVGNEMLLRWNGSAWETSKDAPTNMSAISGSGPSDVWIVGGNGVFHYDGGAWSSRRTGLQGVSYSGVWATSANDVWVVGSGGTILHFAGASPTLERSTLSVDLKGVWASSTSNVFAVGPSGIVLRRP